MLSQLEKLEKDYKSSGLKNNTDYLTELRKQWQGYFEAITSLYDKMYENAKKARENSIKELERSFETAENNLNHSGMFTNQQNQIRLYKELMATAQKEINRLISDEKLNVNDDRVQKAKDDWWTFKDAIDKINQAIYDEGLKYYDDYIQERNKLSNWGNDNEIDALRRKQRFIEQSYRDGLISYKKYVEDMKVIIESLYDATVAKQQAYSNGVLKQLDKEKKALEEVRQEYEKRKSDHETAVSTVTSFIDKQIDLLKQENEEYNKQLQLQRSLMDLERAKSQQTKRIFREGVGFVWEADPDEVNKAQVAHDDLKRQIELEEQIEALEDYKQAWQDAVDDYQKTQDSRVTAELLGDDWEQKILSGQTDQITQFQQEYSEICDQLNEDVEGSIAYQIKQLNDLSEKWSEASDSITDDTDRYKGVVDDLKIFEAANYDERLKLLKSFVKDSKKELDSLITANEKLNTNSKSPSTSPSTTNKTSTPKTSTPTTSQDKSNKPTQPVQQTSPKSTSPTITKGEGAVGTRVKATAAGNAASDGSQRSASSSNKGYIGRYIKGAAFPYRLDSKKNGTHLDALGWYKFNDLEAYAKGTKNAKKGAALVGEDGPEIVEFSGGETVYPADETKKILSNAPQSSQSQFTPIDIKDVLKGVILDQEKFDAAFASFKPLAVDNQYGNLIERMNKISSDLANNIKLPQQPQTVNIGDIVVNNPVGDVNALTREINNTIRNKEIQMAFKKG